MLAEVRRAQYGDLLAVHILLLCAAQRTPTEIAAVLLCSRTTGYRVVKVYRTGQWDGLEEEEETGPAHSPRTGHNLSRLLSSNSLSHRERARVRGSKQKTLFIFSPHPDLLPGGRRNPNSLLLNQKAGI